MESNLYNEEFFRKSVRSDRQHSYQVIASYILENFQPNFVVDYGCGCGWILYYLRKLGTHQVRGVELSKEAMEVQSDNMIKQFIFRRDLRDPLHHESILGEAEVDLSLCIEVAEHIDKKYSDTLLSNITKRTNLLLFSAATPGQGGVGHVNEQPWEYWKEKFQDIKFFESKSETEEMQRYLKEHSVKVWYSNNMRVLRRRVND